MKLVIDGGRKSSEVTAEYGIPVANIYAWVRQARVDSGNTESSRGTTSDRAEVARLRKPLREGEDELSFRKKNVGLLRNSKEERFAAIEEQIIPTASQ